jgi:hypothetical protein
MKASSIPTLYRILATLNRSLAMYLADADPWRRSGDEPTAAALARIVEDQRRDVNRLADAIIDSSAAHVDAGQWPMEFTDLNFLSLDYLLQELIRHQREDVAEIQRCASLLANDRDARELAEEVLGSEQAHLESLEDLARQAVTLRI